MFPQVWEFLFELIEHDFGFLLFELLIPFATVTHRCNCIVRGGPLGDLFIPHVSECSHPFRPPVVLALRVHRYHISSRSEEHTSELQSLMRISYAVFCLKKTNK